MQTTVLVAYGENTVRQKNKREIQPIFSAYDVQNRRINGPRTNLVHRFFTLILTGRNGPESVDEGEVDTSTVHV